ncbi:MAG: TRAP transporter substrate-binding protein [Gammaproteobacteria bacterium]
MTIKRWGHQGIVGHRIWAGALLGLLLTVGCSEGDRQSAAQQHQTYNWRMVTSWPPNSPGLGTAANELARNIETMSAGRLKIKVYGAGELVPALEVFEAVSSGSAHMGHSASYYWRGKIPAAQFFSAVPFGMTVNEQNAWLYYGGGLELWHEIYEPFGLTAFPAGNTGPQWAGWFNKELNTTDDLRGLIMRIPGLGGEVMVQAGAQQQQLPGNEIFTALETGTIDAAEWVNPFVDLSMGFYQVAKYYYYPAWHEQSVTLELLINDAAWQELPQDLQAIVQSAARAANADMPDLFAARNPEILQQLVQEHGVELRPLPKELLLELRTHAQRSIAELVQSDPDFARVHQSWQAFLQKTEPYRKMTETPVLEIRQLD